MADENQEIVVKIRGTMPHHALWELQKQFNDKFWASKGGWPKTQPEITAATKDFAIHLIKEVTEILDELSWKMHRYQPKSVDRINVLEEMIDCQKFLWGLMQLWGFDYDQFHNEFLRKSMVVEQRFDQESQLSALRHLPCAVVDIDGVLADWDAGFSDYLKSEGIYGGLRDYDKMPIADQETWKQAFRKSGRKADLPVLAGAFELLCLLRKGNLKIVLLTNRPYQEHYRIYPDTLEWLHKNHLPYDAIFWAQDKGLEAVTQLTNIAFAIEDKPKNVARLRQARIKVIQLDPNDPGSDTHVLAALAQNQNPMAHLAYSWETLQAARIEVRR